MLDEPTIWPTVRIMTPISIGRMAVVFLVLTAAGGAALVSGILYEKQTPSAVPTALPPAFSPRSPNSGDVIIPAFDVALVGRAGDAVIAGRAAPGAAVELLRNGEPLDRAIADQFGQFVMASFWGLRADVEVSTGDRQAGDVPQECGGHSPA